MVGNSKILRRRLGFPKMTGTTEQNLARQMEAAAAVAHRCASEVDRLLEDMRNGNHRRRAKVVRGELNRLARGLEAMATETRWQR